MNALTTFHTDVKNILEQARGKVRSAVNAAMVEAYWLIGQRILAGVLAMPICTTAVSSL
jgi:hypothetical protein